jgi:hypothetical protein
VLSYAESVTHSPMPQQSQVQHIAVTDPIKQHGVPNKQNKFWVYSQFVFVLQDLLQINACPN